MTLQALRPIAFHILVLLALLNSLSGNSAARRDGPGRPNRLHYPHPLDPGRPDDQRTSAATHEILGATMEFRGREGYPTPRTAQNFDDKRSGSRGPQRAPRYMQRLYEKYLAGEPVRSGSQVADTVRNIVADLAIVKNSSIFVFNLSSLVEKETVLKAEVHMYKRRPKTDPRSKEVDSIAVKVYELGFGYLRERASFHLPESGHARWHVFDVTAVVRSVTPGGSSSRPDEAAAAAAAAGRMLAISFEAADDGSTGGWRGADLRLSKILRRISRPALVIFSRDNNDDDYVEKRRSGNDRLNAVFRDSDADDDDDDDKESNDEKESWWNWNYDNPLRSRRRDLQRRNQDSVHRHPQRRNPGDGTTPPPSNRSFDDEIFEMESFLSNPGGIQGRWKKPDATTVKDREPEEGIGGGGGGRVKFFHAGFSPPSGVERIRVRDFRERSGTRRRKRRKRFVDDNEVLQKEDETTERREEVAEEEEEEEKEEEEPALRRHFYNTLPETNPGILKGRRNSGRRRSYVTTTASPIVAFGETGDDDDDDDDDDDSARQRRRKRKKEEERRARERESSLSVFVSRVGYQRRRSSGRKDPSSSSSSSSSFSSSSGVCRKRELTVNFADIGWKDWIISPSSFEANYCDGSCLYPMASRSRPTNHATIQSIVNVIGLLERVPSPCCVPSSLSSVTLLYLDRNQNVVLKNFPDMTVRTCACR